MPAFHVDWQVGFGILTTILLMISTGTIHLTNMIPQRWIPPVTAWAAFFATINSAILTAMQSLSPGAAAKVGRLLVGLLATIVLVIVANGLMAAGASAGAAERTPAPAPARAIALPPLALPKICDPLNLLPGCQVQTSAANGQASNQPVELNLWSKIVNAALPDLEYASALAVSAGTGGAGVRNQCWQALITANKVASGAGLKDAGGNPLVKPNPALFTDAEQFAEVLDNLAPGGPLWTSCAGAAQLAGTNVLTFINAVVTGAAGLAALGAT